MKKSMPMFLGLCFALLGVAAAADDGRESARTVGDPEGNGAERQSSAEGGGGASGASGAERKPASTATAAGAVYEEVKKGNIKIEVGTDPGAPGY